MKIAKRLTVDIGFCLLGSAIIFRIEGFLAIDEALPEETEINLLQMNIMGTHRETEREREK